jgi:hypothetical protein
MGAIYVDCSWDNPRYYNLQFFDDGSFVLLGTLYRPDHSPRKLTKEEIVRVDGDDHLSEQCPRTARALKSLQGRIPASMKVSHDTWNGESMNHHEYGKYITQAIKAAQGRDKIDLEIEISNLRLKEIAKDFDKILVVGSNHNDFFNRYNERGDYLTQGHNWLPGHYASIAQYHGVDPTEFALNHYEAFRNHMNAFFLAIKDGKKQKFTITTDPKNPKIHMLNKGASYRFGNHELGFHGDQGANGSKGTPVQMFLIFGSIITAHTHSPRLYNSAGVVGTSTPLELDYTRGKPTSWANACFFVYKPKEFKGESKIQMVNIVNGVY